MKDGIDEILSKITLKLFGEKVHKAIKKTYLIIFKKWSFFCYLRKLKFYLALPPRYIKNRYLMRKEYKKRYDGLKVGLLHNWSIGLMAFFTDFQLKSLKLYNINPKKDVVLIGSTTCANQQLQKMYERVVNIEINDRLFKILQNGGHTYLKKIGRYVYDIERYAEDDIKNKNGLTFYTECPKNIEFTEKEINYGKKLLAKIGIQPNDIFITMQNNDNLYWKEIRGVEKKGFNSYRYSKFNDLKKSIEYLDQKGIKVIRGGHYNDEKKINYISLNKLTKEEKDFMDIFVHDYCLFSVNGVSGISNIPLIFRKPLLIHNLIPIGEMPVVEKGIVIPKLLKDKKSKKLLTISEIFNIKTKIGYPYKAKFHVRKISADSFQSTELYDAYDIEIIDNSEDEILEGIKEMLLYTNNKLILTDEQKKLQTRFKELYPLDHPMRHFKGYISPYFLHKHKEIIN